MIVSSAADDPEVCTRFAVTVTPAAISPRAVARAVGDVVAGCVGGTRHDHVVLAVHDVLRDAVTRDPEDPITVRVRQWADRTEIEVVDRDLTAGTDADGDLHVARAMSDELVAERTDAGHVIRLTYRSP